MGALTEPVTKAEQKYCMDCGALILRRAEICPKCGCRQMSPPVPSTTEQAAAKALPPAAAPSTAYAAGAALSQVAGGEIGGKMVILVLLNILWAGLGNICIGDKRGWLFGILTWLFLVIAIYTAGITLLLYFIAVTYAGYTFLQRGQRETR